MRRSSVALGSLAVALILSACGDPDSSASRLSAPGGSLSAGNPHPNPNACDFSELTKSARAFIGSNDVVVKTLIPAMQTAYGSGGTAGATSSGLDILAEIAKARLTSRQVGTINDGADLANEILDAKCTDLRVGVSQETQDEFDAVKALTAAPSR